jgi:regulator-associated protein of mTOR
MTFHAYDQHLVIANETDMIRLASSLKPLIMLTYVTSVWDWSQRKRLNHFCNGNPKGTGITSLHIVNQDVGGIILTGAGMLNGFPM